MGQWNLAVFLLAAALPCRLGADGGVVEIRAQSGPFVITLFSADGSMRAGRPVDLSVLVETADGRTPVLDGEVTLDLEPPQGRPLHLRATHEAATNKLLYAAFPTMTVAGNWIARVRVARGSEAGQVRGRLSILPPAPALITYWPYFALVPLLIALYVLNQSLKRRR